VFGIAVSVARTVVLIRVLTDNNVLDSEKGHIAVGWLIVEDIFTVLVLVLLPAVASSGTKGGGDAVAMLLSVALAILKIGALGALVLLGGGKLIPWILAKIARTRSRELFTLAVLAFALAIAAFAAMAFGASMALGAFLAGMVVGQSKMSEQAAADALPLKDAFAVLFFVSVGMLFDPRLVLGHMPLFLAAMGIILVAKPLGAFLLVLGFGYTVPAAITVAAGLAQIGEFSFILSSEARRLELLPPEGYSVIVAAALVSISLNPPLFKTTSRVEAWLRGRRRLWSILDRSTERKGRRLNESAATGLGSGGGKVRAVVVGYGPVGRTATRLLESFGIQPVVIDLNVDSVALVAASGGSAIYGDAGKADILKAAGIEAAKYLIVTLPDLSSRIPVITTARRLNGTLTVFSRARYLTERPLLEGLGVTEVCYEEAESAVGLSKLLLRSEGADESRIREAMARLHEELALAPPRKRAT
jgi:CPA2 family monovalent cation:H+ antiporter-2